MGIPTPSLLQHDAARICLPWGAFDQRPSSICCLLGGLMHQLSPKIDRRTVNTPLPPPCWAFPSRRGGTCPRHSTWACCTVDTKSLLLNRCCWEAIPPTINAPTPVALLPPLCWQCHWRGSHWRGSHWRGSHWRGSHWRRAMRSLERWRTAGTIVGHAATASCANLLRARGRWRGRGEAPPPPPRHSPIRWVRCNIRRAAGKFRQLSPDPQPSSAL